MVDKLACNLPEISLYCCDGGHREVPSKLVTKPRPSSFTALTKPSDVHGG